MEFLHFARIIFCIIFFNIIKSDAKNFHGSYHGSAEYHRFPYLARGSPESTSSNREFSADGLPNQRIDSNQMQDFFSRYREFEEDNGQNVDLGSPVQETDPSSFGDPNRVTSPRKVVRIRSKLTPFYVRNSPNEEKIKEITAYYVVIEVYWTRFQTKNIEAVEPYPEIRIWNNADQPSLIYVRDSEGYFTPVKLEKSEKLGLSGGVDGKIPIAVATDEFWNEMSILRIEIDGLPSGIVYTLSANLNTFSRLQNLTPEDLVKERAKIKIVEENYQPENARAALAATNSLMRQVSFAESRAAFQARTNSQINGYDTKLSPSDYRRYMEKYQDRSNSARPWLSEDLHVAHQRSSRKRKFDDSSMPKIFKRSLSSDDLHAEEVYGDYEEWLIRHVHVPQTPHSKHWELKFSEDGQIGFSSLSEDSVLEREKDHTGKSLAEVRQEHQLFKRDLRDSIKRAIHAFKDEVFDAKSIIVSEEGDELIVKIFKKGGRIVRKILQFVHQALDMVKQIWQKLGIAVKKFLHWLKSLFHWSSFMRALKVSTNHSTKISLHALNIVQNRINSMQSTVSKWKSDVITALDATISKISGAKSFGKTRAVLQNQAFNQQQDEDHQSSYMADIVNSGMNSEKAILTCNHIPGMKKVSLKKSFEKMTLQLEQRVGKKLTEKQMQKIWIDSVGSKELSQGLFTSAVIHFLKFVKHIIQEVFEIGQELVSSISGDIMVVLNDLNSFMNCEFEYGPLSDLWHYLTRVEGLNSKRRERFALSSVLMLPGSLYFVLSYKIHHNGEEPFDNHDLRSIMLAQQPTEYISYWVRCVQCRSLEELPLKKRMNMLTWLFGYHKIFMTMLLSMVEPAQRLANKFASIPASVVKPVFHYLHHMMSFPFQTPDRQLFNPVSIETWKYGLVPLVFANSPSWGSDYYDDTARVIFIGLSVLDVETSWRKEMSLVEYLNPLSGRSLHWKLKEMSQVLNSIPMLPNILKLKSYVINGRLVSAVLDKTRMEMDIYMNWNF